MTVDLTSCSGQPDEVEALKALLVSVGARPVSPGLITMEAKPLQGWPELHQKWEETQYRMWQQAYPERCKD